ncbi:MAG: CPBP family intramembrane metalloprotease [Anaerolineales bacterium]|nr:CPBP family intramembrane metalloprotease [Anaerolineales bacterium]
MSDLLWRFGMLAIAGLFLWILHRFIGTYPPAQPRSKLPKATLRAALSLAGIAISLSVIRVFWISPWLERLELTPTLRELVQVPLWSIPYLLLPICLVTRKIRWDAADLGLTSHNQSPDATIFAVAFGLVSGGVAYFTGQSNISIQVLPLGALLTLFYTNAFLEEFYHRGVIQSLLERASGQRKAIWWGGVLFGLTHVALDASALGETGGIVAVFSALLLQTMAGWMFGIIYMKTRTLWPGVLCHYLANWLPSLLVLLLG